MDEAQSRTAQQQAAGSSLLSRDMELMQEFEEETETIFKQSETCYTHYKAMLRQENWTQEERKDKKFFKKQVTVAQESLYSKKIPTWASDFDLLAQVVALQTQQREAGECFCNKGSYSRATTGVTSTACQCQMRETMDEMTTRITAEKKALNAKVNEMIKEQLRGLKQKFATKTGSTGSGPNSK